MKDIEIRKVGLSEIESLQEISIKTFFETFAASNTEENMKKYLENSFSTNKLSAEISDPNVEFYFALQNEIAIGYLKLNFEIAQTELRAGNAVEIERIYVIKDFHGKNIGQLLYEKAIETAHQKNAEYIWLGVWEENPRAINFYRKNGFVEFDKHIFILGEDKQTDIMMKLTLK